MTVRRNVDFEPPLDGTRESFLILETDGLWQGTWLDISETAVCKMRSADGFIPSILCFFYSLIVVDLWFGLVFLLFCPPTHTHARSLSLSLPSLSSSLDFHRVIRNRRRLRDSACVRACVSE